MQKSVFGSSSSFITFLEYLDVYVVFGIIDAGQVSLVDGVFCVLHASWPLTATAQYLHTEMSVPVFEADHIEPFPMHN